jgi:hypothetical protein
MQPCAKGDLIKLVNKKIQACDVRETIIRYFKRKEEAQSVTETNSIVSEFKKPISPVDAERMTLEQILGDIK